MVDVVTYGDISPRTAAKALYPLLKRGDARMILEKFGQVYVLPLRSSKTGIFRRYEALSLALTPLVEGVTPSGSKPKKTDVTVNLLQYGDFIAHSDVIEDTYEDPILQVHSELCMQQWTETAETLRWNVVKAGTSVGYANGPARSDVNSPIRLEKQRTATNSIIRQRGQHHTDIVSSNGNFRTEPIEAAFIGVAHADVENDIRNMSGFIPTKQYGSQQTAWPNEIGSV